MAENCEKCKFRAHYNKGGTRDVDNIVGGDQKVVKVNRHIEIIGL